MDISRSEQIASLVKDLGTLGKNIKKPLTPEKLPTLKAAKGLVGIESAPIAGSGFIRILMYLVAGILAICLILLAVDQWITPVFQRTPGGDGYIAIPGADNSELHWPNLQSIDDIRIGAQPSPNKSAPNGSTGAKKIQHTEIVEGQSIYSITMDIYITNEYPQNIGVGNDHRVFFLLGNSLTTPTIRVSLDNAKNTLYITSFDSEGLQESVQIDNVPIHTPFRIGFTKSPKVLEGYLNGLLVQTRRLRSISRVPTSGDIIYSPANIRDAQAVNMAQGIKILNLRIFPYIVDPKEMMGRMVDVASKTRFVSNNGSIVGNNWEFDALGIKLNVNT